MATLISLRRKIKAAQNISKTTRAFQMIAASKLKKAQDATFASRPYVTKLTSLTQSIAERIEDTANYPYLTLRNDTKKTLLIAISPDKGLCGGLVSNLLKEFLTYTKNEKDGSYIVVGKKIENQVVRLQNETVASFSFGTTLPSFSAVYPIVKLIDEYYLSGNIQTVKILYTDFSSFFSQTPKIATILPVALAEEKEQHASSETLYEPGMEQILPSLLKHYLEMSLYQFMLESYLSEQAARMIAMQNATNNAKDLIEGYKLEYNKTRQAKITSELLDITGGRAVANA